MTMDSWSDGDGDAGDFDALDDPTPGMDDDTLDLGGDFDALDDDVSDVDDDTDDPGVGEEDDVVDTLDDDPEPDDDPVEEILDEEIPGTDPDATDVVDDPAFEPQFPPELELDPRPEPVDGQPWSDAGLLGDGDDSGDVWNPTYDSPNALDLQTLDAGATGGWDALLMSDDPAVSSLARWWHP